MTEKYTPEPELKPEGDEWVWNGWVDAWERPIPPNHSAHPGDDWKHGFEMMPVCMINHVDPDNETYFFRRPAGVTVNE